MHLKYRNICGGIISIVLAIPGELMKEKWKYLYRAIDIRGRTIDFYLSNTSADKQFLDKCFRAFKDYEHPRVINKDQNAAYSESSLEKKLSVKPY